MNPAELESSNGKSKPALQNPDLTQISSVTDGMKMNDPWLPIESQKQAPEPVLKRDLTHQEKVQIARNYPSLRKLLKHEIRIMREFCSIKSFGEFFADG